MNLEKVQDALQENKVINFILPLIAKMFGLDNV